MFRPACCFALLSVIGTLNFLVTESVAEEPTLEDATNAGNASGSASSNSSQGEDCIPYCRVGYICVTGRCISACNPPCAADETCTANAECVPKATENRRSSRNHAEEAPEKRGYRLHDGFFLRLGIGFGWMAARKQSGGEFNFSSTSDFSGLTLVDEFSLGGAVDSGLIVGVGIYSASAPSPAIEYSSHSSMSGNVDDTKGTGSTGTLSAFMLGPFADYYPNPRRGIHFQGSVGGSFLLHDSGGSMHVCRSTTVNGLSTSQCGTDILYGDASGFGLGAMLGVGFEDWVSEEWSLGVMARIMYAHGQLDSSDVDAVFPGLLFAATYN